MRRGRVRGALRLSAPLVIALVLASVVTASVAPPPFAAPIGAEPSRSIVRAITRAHIGRNVSLQDPSGRALEAFHAALRRAERGEGQARIAFYGGSHTAGDTMTGRIREILQSRFGDAGHGFVPLVPVVRDHWAWGVRIDAAEGWEVSTVGQKRAFIDRYGIAGVAYTAEEPGAFAAVTSAPWGPSQYASRITLLYDRRPGAGTLDVLLDGRLVESISTSAERPAGAMRAYVVSDGPHRLETRARGDAPVTIYGVLFDRDRPGVVVDNLGLVGAKARHHLFWDEDQWRGFFAVRRPDLVAFAYGNNELDDRHLGVREHEAHLREVLARVRTAAPNASCLLIGPTDRPRRREDGAVESQPLVEEMTAMHRRVAHDSGCAFFDTLAFMGGPGAGVRWLNTDPPLLADDLMHLSRDAYLRWGDVLAAALLERYSSEVRP